MVAKRRLDFLGLVSVLGVNLSVGCSGALPAPVTGAGGTTTGGAVAATGGRGAGGVAGPDASGDVADIPQTGGATTGGAVAATGGRGAGGVAGGDAGGEVAATSQTGGAAGAAGMPGTGGISSSGGAPSTGSTVCTAGRCLVTLVSGRQRIWEIAVSANGVHWLEASSRDSVAPGQGDGRVMKVPLDGGTPVTLASGQDEPHHLRADSRNVYWTTFWVNQYGGMEERGGNSVLMRNPSNGGETTTVVSMPLNPDTYSYREYLDFVVQDSSAYWACRGTWGSTYYRDGFILKVSLLDGSTTTLASDLLGPWGVAVDATSIYWRSEYQTGPVLVPRLMKMPLAGGPVTTLDLDPVPVSGVLDAGNLYWTIPSDGTVMKVPLDGGVPITLAAGRTSLDPAIAVDADSVYWTEGQRGTLVKVALQGGTPTTLVTGQSIGALTVDSTSVYWTDTSAVMKLTPK